MRKLVLTLVLLCASLAFAQSVGGIFFETSYTRSQGTAATPTFSPVAGTYSGTQSVTISSSTAGSTLCYTTNGTDPAASTPGTCSSGSTYSTPVSVASSLTLKALATKAAYINSAVGSAVYTIATGNSDDFSGTSVALATHNAAWASSSYVVTSLKTSGSSTAQMSATYQNGGARYSTSTSDTSQIVLKPWSVVAVQKGVCVRMGASTMGYCLYILSASGGNWTVAEIDKGSYGTYLANSSGKAYSQASDHTLKIICAGTTTVTCSGYVDGALAVTSSDSSSPIASGNPGFFLRGDATLADTQVAAWQDF